MHIAIGIGNSFRGLAVRQIVAAVLLVLFAITNFAVQTHIHGAFAAGVPGAIAGSAMRAPISADPGDHDAQHCPLCQEFLSGGNFLSPVAPVVALPVLMGFAVMVPPVQRSGLSAAHGWQSRAPPAA